MGWDDDDKTRRNLVIASAAVLAHAYLDLPGLQLVAKLGVGPFDPLRLAGLTLLLLGYLFVRFALSDEGRDIAIKLRVQRNSIYRDPLIEELERDFPGIEPEAAFQKYRMRVDQSSGGYDLNQPEVRGKIKFGPMDSGGLQTPIGSSVVTFHVASSYNDEEASGRGRSPPPVLVVGSWNIGVYRWLCLAARAWLRAIFLTSQGFNLLAPTVLWTWAWGFTAFQFLRLCTERAWDLP